MIVVQGNEAAAWVARRSDGGCRHQPRRTHAFMHFKHAVTASISLPYSDTYASVLSNDGTRSPPLPGAPDVRNAKSKRWGKLATPRRLR